MRIRDIEAYFETLYPENRKCSWDNDGLLFCPDRDREVTKILTCLDVTFPAIEKAVNEGCELIVSHHPLIFSPIDRITEDTIVGQKLILMMEAGISLLSIHTRFDGAIGGLNSAFAQKIGILPTMEGGFLPDEPYIGGIGKISSKCSPEDFAKMVSESLDTTVKLYSAGLDVQIIGYCCGSGKDLVSPCLKEGADAFVGGDIPYHVAVSAVEEGMTVIDCGHHGSEKIAVRIFAENLYSFSPDLKVFPFYDDFGGQFVKSN